MDKSPKDPRVLPNEDRPIHHDRTNNHLIDGNTSVYDSIQTTTIPHNHMSSTFRKEETQYQDRDDSYYPREVDVDHKTSVPQQFFNLPSNFAATNLLLTFFNQLQNTLFTAFLASVMTLPMLSTASALLGRTNLTASISSEFNIAPFSIHQLPSALLHHPQSPIQTRFSSKSFPTVQPTFSPHDDIDQSWAFDVGQLVILAEAIAFFVIGCLSLFQVRILVDAQKQHISHESSTTAMWPHRSMNARALVPSSSTLTASLTRPVSLTGGKTRALFIALLCLSNFVRSISLVFMALWVNPANGFDGDDFPPSDVREWDLYLLQSFPALLFLSTYSVVVLFWAQVYYATLLVSVPLLRPAFVFLNLAALLVFIIMAVLTRSLGAYIQFRNYTLSFVGGLHLFIGAMFVYFGIQVAAQFAHQGKGSKARDSIIRRVVFLSVICPLIFALRGAMSLCFVFKITLSDHPAVFSRLSWDALVFLVTELIPVALILGSFWSSGRPTNQARSSGSSTQTDIQAPLLDGQLLGELRASLGNIPGDGSRYTQDGGIAVLNQQNLQIADALYDSEFCVRPPNFLDENHSYGSYSHDPRIMSQHYHSPPIYNHRNWDISRPQPPDPWDISEESHYRDIGDYPPQPSPVYDSSLRRPYDGTIEIRTPYREFQASPQYRAQSDYNEAARQQHHYHAPPIMSTTADITRAPTYSHTTTTDTIRLPTTQGMWNNPQTALETDYVVKRPRSIASSSSSAHRTSKTWCFHHRQSPQSLHDVQLNNHGSFNESNYYNHDKDSSNRQITSPRSGRSARRSHHNNDEHERRRKRRDHHIMSAPTRDRRSKRKTTASEGVE